MTIENDHDTRATSDQIISHLSHRHGINSYNLSVIIGPRSINCLQSIPFDEQTQSVNIIWALECVRVEKRFRNLFRKWSEMTFWSIIFVQIHIIIRICHLTNHPAFLNRRFLHPISTFFVWKASRPIIIVGSLIRKPQSCLIWDSLAIMVVIAHPVRK